jgi:hypothetical protein
VDCRVRSRYNSPPPLTSLDVNSRVSVIPMNTTTIDLPDTECALVTFDNMEGLHFTFPNLRSRTWRTTWRSAGINPRLGISRLLREGVVYQVG